MEKVEKSVEVADETVEDNQPQDQVEAVKSDTAEIEDKIEEVAEEVTKDITDEVAEKSSDISESDISEPEEEAPVVNQNVKKSPVELIDEARTIVNNTDSVVKDCMQILNEDIDAYEKRKKDLLEGSAKTADTLLEEIGFEPEMVNDMDGDMDFHGEDPIKPMQVKDLSSGKFGAFITALIAGVAVIAVWIYMARDKFGIHIDPSRVPSEEVQNRLFSKVGAIITGGQENFMIGVAVVGISILLIMWIVYSLKVYLRGIKNEDIAQKVNEDAQFYCTKKEECKKEMEKVSEHIHQTIKTLDTYDIFLNEQNAIMKRIIYLEGNLPFDEYHDISKEEIKRANLLDSSFTELVSIPMSDENGSLSNDSKDALNKAIRTQEIYRESIYK